VLENNTGDNTRLRVDLKASKHRVEGSERDDAKMDKYYELVAKLFFSHFWWLPLPFLSS